MTLEPSATTGEEDGLAIYRRADELAAFSSDGADRLTRLYLTPEHQAAAQCVAEWMREAGMSVALDAAGTVVGRYAGLAADAPTLLLGSHIDTVRNAGKYDGNLGVITAIQAVRRLSREGRRLTFALEVLAFGDEEGVRFPVTLTSSRAIAGSFDPAALDVKDTDGISLRQALTAFGGDPDRLSSIARDPGRVCGYVEVHIEQGPVLDQQGAPVGIVTAISGATRMRVRVSGFAGHAGTIPMSMRRDAGVAAAEMLLAIEAIARESDDVVATIGCMAFDPGAVNVIPSGANFTLDLRSPNDASRQAARANIDEALAGIAQRRNVRVEVDCFYDENAATCDAALASHLASAVRAKGIEPLYLPSGAGHDGLSMVALCPFAMLFVRCKDGISHNPSEAIAARDAGVACDVLYRFLTTYRSSNESPSP